MSGGKSYQPRVGDCVRLKGGHVNMTITVVDSEKLVRCAWHTGVGNLEGDLFPIAALDVVEGQGALAP